MIKKAVIPIGGLGTRFLPATKGMAKEMFPVVEKPILLLILEECANSGIEEVFLVLSPNKMFVKKFFEDDASLEARLAASGKLAYLDSFKNIKNKLKISFGVQEVARGSGDALFPAEKWAKGEPFAVLFGDDLNYTPNGMRPVIGQLIDTYNQTGKLVIGCKYVDANEIHKYSSCILGKQLSENVFETSGIIEKPSKEEAPSLLSGLARYVLPGNIFAVLRRTPIGRNGELNLTDAMDIVAREEGAVACNFQSIRYDTGDKLGYVQATVEYALRHPEIGKDVLAYLVGLAKKGYNVNTVPKSGNEDNSFK